MTTAWPDSREGQAQKLWRSREGTGKRARDHHLTGTTQHTDLVTVTTSICWPAST